MAVPVPLTPVSGRWLELVAAAVPGGRTVRPDGLHITLRYLGPIEIEDPAPLLAELGAAVAAAGPFAVRVEGLGAFPSLRRPRAVWMGVTRGREQLVGLGRLLAPTAPEIRPHCTLARVGSRLGADAVAALQELAGSPLPPLEFHCEAAALFESRPAPRAPNRYRRLGSLPLLRSAPEGPAPEGVE